MKYMNKKNEQTYEVVKVEGEVITLVDSTGKEKAVKQSTLKRNYVEVAEETTTEEVAPVEESQVVEEPVEAEDPIIYDETIEEWNAEVAEDVERYELTYEEEKEISVAYQNSDLKELQRIGNNNALTYKENVARYIAARQKFVSAVASGNQFEQKNLKERMAKLYDRIVRYRKISLLARQTYRALRDHMKEAEKEEG